MKTMKKVLCNMDKNQQAAFEKFFAEKEALGNWEEKTVGITVSSPGHVTTKSIGDAYEAIHAALALHGDPELVSWADEMYLTILQYGVQVALLYALLKDTAALQDIIYIAQDALTTTTWTVEDRINVLEQGLAETVKRCCEQIDQKRG